MKRNYNSIKRQNFLFAFLLLLFFNTSIGKSQNRAINFNALGNNSITIPHNSNFNSPSAGFTVEAWIRTTQNAPEATIINKYDAGGDGWMLAVDNGQLMGWHQGFTFNTSTAVLNDGQWKHVAMVVTATEKILYVDGIVVDVDATGSKTSPINTLNVTIGNYPSAGSRYFNGDIDEVRVWNVARTCAEIKSTKDRELVGNEAGLHAYYNFNQGIASGTNTGLNSLISLPAGNNGTLTNFTLSGATSNWVDATANGVIVGSPIAQFVINLQGNNTNIANNSVTPSLTNFTDFGNVSIVGNLVRTYTIQNTGAGSLSVSNVALSGVDASLYTISGLPAFPFTINGSSSQTFNVTFTPTTIGIKNATVTITSNDCANSSYNFAIQGTGTAAAVNNALNFDGTNDLVDVIGGPNVSSNFTVEAWIKPASRTTISVIASKKTSGLANPGWSFFINGFNTSDGTLHFETQNNDASTVPGVITVGVWQHVSAVVNGTSVQIYKNGIAQTMITSTAFVATSPSNLRIGAFTLTPFIYAGDIDELRIWNIARTCSQVLSTKDRELVGNESGLVAYYNFNQGVAGGTNTGLNSLISVPAGNNGTLSTFALSGATSNWVDATGNGVIVGSPLVILQPTINLQGNNTNITNNSVTPSLTNFTSFGTILPNNNVVRTYTIQNTGIDPLSVSNVALSGVDASLYTISGLPAFPFNVAPSSSQTFNVTFTPTTTGVRNATLTITNNDCANAIYNFAIRGTSDVANKALNFDGTDQGVIGGTSINPVTTFTFESWVRVTGGTGAVRTIATVRNASFQGYSVTADSDNNWRCTFGNGSTWNILNSNVSVSLNTWTHIAVTYNGTTMFMYVNGVLANSLVASFVTNGSGSIIGANYTPAEYMIGDIDEIRVWSVSRSCSQIKSTMTRELVGNESSLFLYYKLNEGVAAGSNTPIAYPTALGAAGAQTLNIGTLTRTGTTSNWIDATGNGVIVGSPIAQPIINLQGNSSNIANNSVTPSLTNFTDFGAVLIGNNVVRTYTIQNTGAGDLSVSNVALSGLDASLYTISGLPAFPFNLAASSSQTFNVTFTPTTAGVKNATLTITNNDCANGNYNFAIRGTSDAANKALNFDGVNDAGIINTSINPTTTFTFESWVRVTGGSGTVRTIGTCLLISSIKGYSVTAHSDNRWRCTFGNGSGSVTLNSNILVSLNVWTHIAVTYNGTTMFIYVNGVLANSIVSPFVLNDTSSSARVGVNYNSLEYMVGDIDEIRVWNMSRTCSEIKSTMTRELVGNESNLYLYYKLNEGIAAGSNTGVSDPSSLGLAVGQALSISASFARTGTTSNWIDATANGVIVGSPIAQPTINLQGNNTNITNNSVTPSLTNFTDFGAVLIGNNLVRTYTIQNTGAGDLSVSNVALSGLDASLYTISGLPAFPFNLAASSSQTFNVTFTPTTTGVKNATVTITNNDCANGNYNFAIRGTSDAANKALNFDGSDDLGIINTSINPTTNFTFESWVRVTGGTGTRRIIAKVENGTFQGYSVTAGTDNNWQCSFGNGSSLVILNSNTSVVLNTWTHIAVTYNGTTMFIYVNGVLANSIVATFVPNTSITTSRIGIDYSGIGLMVGDIDEIRVWNTSRTCSQIKSTMTRELVGNETNLFLYYKLNEGIANGSNPVINPISLGSGAGQVLFVLNFLRTGTTSNWIDATANGVIVGSPIAQATINLQGNNTNIANNSVTPSLINFTDFGTVFIGNNLVRTYIIQNIGAGALSVSSVALSGLDASLYTISGLPGLPFNVAGSSSQTFSVTFTPTNTIGLKNANVTIISNDCANSSYNFALQSNVALGNLTALPANGITNTTFIANWTPIIPADKYRLDVSEFANFTTFVSGYNNRDVGNVSFVSIIGIQSNKTYYYRLRAENAGNIIANNSNVIQVRTLLDAPTDLAINTPTLPITSVSFPITWLPVSDASGYYVFVSTATDPNFDANLLPTYNSFAVAGQTTTTTIISGLQPNTQYYVRVKAYVAPPLENVVASAYSNEINVLTSPLAPVATNATSITDITAIANWNVVANAISYTLETSADNFTTITNTFTGLTTNSQVLTGLVGSTNYQYRVRATNGTFSFNSNIISFTTSPTPPATPTGFAITNTTFNSVSLSWNNVVGANGYYLDLATDAAFTNIIPSFNPQNVGLNLSTTINSLSSNTLYYARLRAYSGVSSNIIQSLNTATLVITTLPAAPIAIAAGSITNTSFDANWNALSGNGSVIYNIQVSQDNFSTLLQTITFISGTTQSIVSLLSGTYYYYRVNAVNSNGTSANSNIITVLTLPNPVIANPATTVTSASFVANWTTSTSAGGVSYILEYGIDNTFASILGTQTLSTNNPFNIVGLSPNTTYYYRIKVVNVMGNFTVSNIVSVTTNVSPPAIPVATANTPIDFSSFVANWQVVANATSYRLDVSSFSDFSSFVSGYTDLDVTNVLSYNVTGLSGNINYYYRVRAVNAGGGISGSSNVITALTLPSAGEVQGETNVTTNSFTANWKPDPSSNPVTYEVQWWRVALPNDILVGSQTLLTTLAFNVTTSLLQNEQYYYTVRKTNSSGTGVFSSPSSPFRLLCPPTTTLPATVITDVSFTANWNTVPGATFYYLDVSTSPTFATFLVGYNGFFLGTNSQIITGLTANTQYYYRVRAQNASPNNTVSINSDTRLVQTSLIPIALASTPITNITTNSFRVNWVTQSGITGYYVYVATDNSSPANFEASLVPNLNPFIVAGQGVSFADITGLSSNTNYYVKVKTYSGVLTSAYSLPATTLTLPNIIIANVPTSVTSNSFQATWNAISGNGAFTYEIQSSAGSQLGISNVFFDYTSLTPATGGRAYTYRVRATNTSGSSNVSNEITVITTPISTAATIPTLSGFTANWNTGANIDGYEVQVSLSNTFASLLFTQNVIGVANNSFVFNTLNPSTNYFYRIRAYSGTTYSFVSNIISVNTLLAPLAAPLATSPTLVTNVTATANWDIVAGAVSYTLETSNNNFVSILNTFAGLTTNSQALTGLNPLTNYQYRIRAINTAAIPSVNSNVINFATLATPPATPTGFVITNLTANTLQLSWNSVIGVNGYYVDLATDVSFANFVSPYNPVDVGLNTSLTINNLPLNTVYYARLRSYTGAGANLVSSVNTPNLIINTLPTIPTALAGTLVTNNSFTANWNVITGTALGIRYNVQASTDPTFSTGLITQNNVIGTTVNFTGLSAGTVYYYRVFGNNDSNSPSLSSNTISVVTTPIATTADNIVANSFRANWNIVNGASDYSVEVSLVNTFASLVTSQNITGSGNNNFTFTGLTNNTNYFYRVFAKVGSVTSPASNVISVTTLLTSPNPPVATSATSITTTSFAANWNVVSGTSVTYTVELSDDNFTTILSTQTGVTGLSATFSALSSNKSYTYRVRAIDGSVISLNSNLINVITLPNAITANPATAINTNSFTANWTAFTGTNLAVTYTLQVATDNLFANIINTQNNLTNLSANLTSLTFNTNYFYRVIVVNASGSSAFSNVTSLQTNSIAPNATDATNILDISMTANWDLVPNATAYRFDLSTSNTFATFVTGYNNILLGNVNTLNLTGLTQNTVYYYRVRAVNVSGNISPNSNVITQRTLLLPPTALTISNTTSNSFQINWNEASGVGGYYVYVSTATGANFENGLIPSYNPLNISGTGISGNPINTTITGLSSNSNYYVRLKSYLAPPASPVLLSDYTSELFILTIPSAPLANIPNPNTEVTNTGFTAKWNAISGNGTTPITYTIETATNLTFSSIISNNIVGVTNVLLPITGLNAGSLYYYRVKASNTTGISATSNTVTVITQPVAIAGTLINVSNFTANWNVVNGASGYIVELSADNFSSTLLTQTLNGGGNNSYVFSGLTAGTNYFYRVRAILNITQSPASNIITTTTLLAPPNAPVATAPTNILYVSATFDYSGVANWNVVSGITNYRFDLSTDANFNTFVVNDAPVPISVTSYSLINLIPSTNYYYRVRAVNSQNTPSFNSNVVNFTTPITPPPAPQGFVISTPTPNPYLTTNNTNNTLSFAWDAVFGADGYNLELSTTNTFGTLISTYNPRNVGAGNSFVANNLLLPNTNYFARLRSYIGVVNSNNSTILATSTLAPAPVATAATSVDVTNFTANWNLITGVGNAIVTYRIEVSTVSNFATILLSRDNLTSNSEIFTSADGIQAGSVYYYRVFSRNLGGVSILSSNIVSAITKPNSLPATEITSVGFKANWDVVTNASSYTIELATNNTFTPILLTNNINGSANNNFVYNNLNAGTTYFYRVRAVIGSFTSPNSNPITLSTNIAVNAPNPPTALPATNIGTGSFKANWTLIANADKYFIDVSSNPSFTAPLVLDNLDVGNVTFLDISGVGAGSTFYYRIRSFNLLGTSANSNEISVLTALAPIGTPAQPTNTSIFVSSLASMDFNWKDNSDNEIGFEVQRSQAFSGPFVTVFTAPANPSATNLNLSFTDTGLQENTLYFYRVRALGVGGNNSNFTLPISETTFRDAPLEPTALFAQTFSASQIQLNWVDNSSDEIGFNIYRALATGGTFTLAGSVAANTTLYIDNGLVINTSYQYIVKAVKGTNESDQSNIAFAETKDVPAPPSNLVATAVNSKSINLTWVDNSNNEDHFIIQMAYLDNGNIFDFRAEVPANSTSFVIGAGTSDNPFLDANQTYRFRITAVDVNETRSIFSNIATASTPIDPNITRPNAPIEVRGESVSTAEISIKWKDNSNNEDYFKITRSTTLNGVFVEIARVPRNTNRFSDLTVSAGATYFYRVYASNGGGDSDPGATSGIAICNVIVVVNTDLPNNGTIVCDTKKVLLTLNTNVTIQNARLQWFKNGAPIENAILDSYQASETGEYYCRVIAGACDKKSEIKSIIINPSFNVTITYDNGVGGSGKLETNLLGANSYQWFYEYQPIVGATSDTYLPLQKGAYYLVVINNSCSTTSNVLMINELPNAIENDNLNDYLSVSPNPTDSKATVKLTHNLIGDCEISLIDMQGKSITLFKDVKDTAILEQTFDLTPQANGLYIIQVKINNKIGRKKIIKK